MCSAELVPCFILTYFNISRSRSKLLCKQNVSKNVENFTKKSLMESLCNNLTSCRPRVCKCIKIESTLQVFSSDFCEISQSSYLQNNREWLLVDVGWFMEKIL